MMCLIMLLFNACTVLMFVCLADLGDWEVPAGVQRFTLQDLARITSNFSDGHVIGAGGFGKVFWGTLEDGRTVAIKRASATSMQGTGEFRNEITLLSRLHHRHLVRLEGFCDEQEMQACTSTSCQSTTNFGHTRVGVTRHDIDNV